MGGLTKAWDTLPNLFGGFFFFSCLPTFSQIKYFYCQFLICKFLTVPNRKDKDLKDPTLRFSSLQPLNTVISQYFKLNQCFIHLIMTLVCFPLDQLTGLWLYFLSYATFCLTINSCLCFLFDKISASLSLSQTFQQKSKNELFWTQPWKKLPCSTPSFSLDYLTKSALYKCHLRTSFAFPRVILPKKPKPEIVSVEYILQ